MNQQGLSHGKEGRGKRSECLVKATISRVIIMYVELKLQLNTKACLIPSTAGFLLDLQATPSPNCTLRAIPARASESAGTGERPL